MEIAVVKSVRGVANNADNAEEEVVKAGAAVQAVQNATEEASTKDAEVDTIAAKATVIGVSRESPWRMTLRKQWLMCKLP